MKDNVNPSHYKQGKVECIDAIASATINKRGLDAVCTSNVLKYLWRCESKGGLEDMKKAIISFNLDLISKDFIFTHKNGLEKFINFFHSCTNLFLIINKCKIKLTKVQHYYTC
jgi:hypothetical protein